MVLGNGSVLVVGGEVGSNGAPEPSLEILPTPVGGPTWMFLDYLDRTDPNNLYPFLHVLPSGRIFVGARILYRLAACKADKTPTGYYNEARILNPTTLQTDTVLPNMPGSVTSFLAGRTYPLEGTAVLMPQYAPYTDPVTLLICGGSNFGTALDNCVSIQPEVENPEWIIERMVKLLSPVKLRFLTVRFAALEACYAVHCKCLSDDVFDSILTDCTGRFVQ